MHSPDPHKLSLERIDPAAASKIEKKLIVKYGEVFSAKCSCGFHIARHDPRGLIRAVHDAHVQEMLGPDRLEAGA